MIPPETLAAALRVAEHRALSAMLALQGAQPNFTFAPEPQPQHTAEDGGVLQTRPADTGH